MVFGLFEGGVDLVLESANWRFGQRLKGTAQVKLKKPENANAFYVHLIGERRETNEQWVNGAHQRRTTVVTVFKSDVQLSGSRLYSTTESFPFEIQLPANPNPATQASQAPSSANPVVNAILSTLANPGVSYSPIQWYVEAHLDLPNALDMRKKVPINLG